MKTLTALIFFAIIGAIYGLGYLTYSVNDFTIDSGIVGIISCLGIGFIVAVIICLSVWLSAELLSCIYDTLTKTNKKS